MDDTAPTFSAPAMQPGWVWLAGAGPGDPGLLTLHAASALGEADAVVHDALVSADILRMIRPGAQVEYAGKRGGGPALRQQDISGRLVTLARRGLRVLRLKGGDPFMFGRGGEEALALVRAGVPFRLVPGITAGVGGLAAAGIPPTHRDINHAVTFVTGHLADSAGDHRRGRAQPPDWNAIAQGSPVIVLYMALGRLDAIARQLLAAGRAPTEPVAVISDASLPTQKVLETTLASAAADARAADMTPPALVVVGGVVALRSGLDWIGALAGRALDPDPLAAGTEAQTQAD